LRAGAHFATGSSFEEAIMAKQHMSTKKFNLIYLPIVGFTVALLITADVVMNKYSASLDTYLGMGQKVITGGGHYNESDTDYYDETYPRSMDGKIASSEAASKVAERLSDEGEVLLKNDGTLPLTKQSKITPLGYRYLNPVMTGTGSGAATLIQDYVRKPAQALAEYFNVNAAMEGKLKNGTVKYATSQGYQGAADNNGTFAGATSSVGEYDPALYEAGDIGDYTTALVFIGRQGGEGGDLQMTPYYSDSAQQNQIAKHQLQLMPYEKEMISFAKAHCSKVIVIVNSSNPLELGDLQKDSSINAILWVGTTGCRGFESMAKILCGEVNPSGKTVDCYYRDFTADPTFKNYGDFSYSNGNKSKYVEYEEGIYLGYKYYESKFSGSAYDDAVVYPFGYGLSYGDSAISQTLDSVSLDATTKTITVKGNITNGSSYAQKVVSEVYLDPAYSSSSKIEKAKKNLVDFAKTAVAANSSASFSISFNQEDIASYDEEGYYSAGKGSYVIEEGDYRFVLGKNSHEEWGSKSLNFPQSLVYADSGSATNSTYLGKRPSDAKVVNNLFKEMSDYMKGEGDYASMGSCSLLTRSDAFASGVTAPNSKAASEKLLQQIQASIDGSFDYNEQLKARYGSSAPSANANNGMRLSMLRGLAYDDPAWEKLLDQLDYDSTQTQYLIGYGAFNTAKVDALGKGATTSSDGPQAIGKTGIADGTGAACAYPAEAVIAATWNKELAKEMGVSIGEESLAQNANEWYGPACNLHRSPFLGRVYEYYSEDAVLSGYMATSVIEGAASKGFSPFLKHFALNDQETNRSGVCTWADEQTMRELYLKPFEMAVKKAKVTTKYLKLTDEASETYALAETSQNATTGIMTSMNYIGGVWASESYALNTDLLRNEWGFQGAVITDSATPSNNQCNNALASGNDFWLNFHQGSYLQNTGDSLVRWSVRTAAHNIGYMVANSNAMQSVGPKQEYYYTTSPWQIGLITANSVLWPLVALFLGYDAWRYYDSKKHPDKYVSKDKKTSA
jgi:beta-glucosidase